MKEYPYLCVRSNACKCQSKSSLLFPSHISMAISIYKYHSYSISKYKSFMKTFYSGLHDNTYNDDNVDDHGNNTDNWKNMDIHIKDGNNKNQHIKSDIDNDRIHCNSHRSVSTATIITRSHSVTWSLRQQCLFSVIASIYCIYRNYRFKASNYKDALKSHHQHHENNSQYHYTSKRPANLEGNIDFHSEKKQFLHDSWLVTQILSRLPHNVHAITKVMESCKDNKQDHNDNSCSGSSFYHRKDHHHITTSDNTITNNCILESTRVGLALFLHASSINHSCDPNAIVRFNRNNNKNDNNDNNNSSSSGSRRRKSSNSNNDDYNSGNSSNHNNYQDRNQKYDIVMEYLRNVYIEIVSTMPINRNTEITISYGPMKGRFEVNLRKQILFCQYLFSCHCVACTTIDNDNNNNNNNQNIKNQYQNSSATSISSKTSTSTISSTQTSINVENVIYLCNRLQQLTEEMYHINANYSEFTQNNIIISYQQSNNNDSDLMKKLIASFHERYLYKMYDKFQELQKIYFPAVSNMKMFSINTNKNNATTNIINDDGGTNIYENRMSQDDDCWNSSSSSRSSFSSNSNYDNNNYLRIYKKFPYYQQQLFIEFCTLLCNYNDIYSHLLSLSYQYHHAIDLIKYNVYLMIISGMYKIDDIVIGRERSKLAGLLFKTSTTNTTTTTTTTTKSHNQRNNYHECLYQAYESMKILQPIVSNDDPDLIEMQQMIYCLQSR